MQRILLVLITAAALTPQEVLAESASVNQGANISEITNEYAANSKSLIENKSINNHKSNKTVDEINTTRSQRLAANNINSTSHTIRPGETLSGIAHRYNIQKNELAILNNIKDPNSIYIGQRIVISQNRNNKFSIHIVNSGESISLISLKYGIPQSSILRANNISESSLIFPGQKLKIPPLNSSVNNLVVKSSEQRLSAKPIFHTVLPGESLSIIAQRYNTNSELIARNNNIEDINKLQVGIKLKIDEKPSINKSENGYKKPNQISFNATKAREYGPLRVFWDSWRTMNGSKVAPTIHKNGKKLFIAVNCPLRKLNATGSDGNWRDWITPIEDFEMQLIDDICGAKRV